MAERAIWSGAITFGLVSIPIKLYAATENKGISFHQIHKKCQSRIQEKRWCPVCERDVDWDEIEKGFEYAKGKYVTVSKEDLEQLPLPDKDSIVIQAFVKLEEIDPIYFDKSYYLQTDKKVSRPFYLLIKALEEKQMVAIGSFAMRSKERLCCLRPIGDTLTVETLLYPDEIKIDLSAKLPKMTAPQQEMNMVHKLIDMMSQKFKPEMYEDHYREALQQIIDAKIAGHELKKAGKSAPKGQLLDLMTALKRSVEKAEKGKSKAEIETTRKSHKRRKAS
jgi:DNA end-binding protein Ku